MDLDRYLATHRADWERLAALSKGGRRRAKRMTAAEIEELVALYQRTSSHLAHVRAYYRDPALATYLTQIVGRARAMIYGNRPRSFRALGRFFTTAYPVTVWRARRFMAASALLLLLPALVSGTWIANSAAARDAAIPPAAREAYIERDFEEYYRSEDAEQFAAEVSTNNISVGIVAFAGGILLFPTAYVLVNNGAQIGAAGGLFASVGQSDKFFGLILPHGLLELTAIIIAGGAGLALGWALFVPGDRLRTTALVDAAQRSIVIVLGLVPTFLIAGRIEGYVTGQPWPTWLRVGIGLVVEIAFLVYIVGLGRSAERKGYSGKLNEMDAADFKRLPTAA